jgi:molybdate transport system regulatory protein
VSAAKPRPIPRLRIVLGADAALGPGKADLLEGIVETGSISAAGRRLKMSYRRAWSLVDELNHLFAEPLVVAEKGGSRGGGAHLTETGEAVLATYRRMEEIARAGMRKELDALGKLAARRR